MRPGVPVEAGSLRLEHEAVPAQAVAGGSPATAVHELGSFGGLAVGVWEMTEGAMHDVEADEVCVVVSGHATVQFHDGGATVELRPGSLLPLRSGMRTTWTVHETLRKVYITH
jgi:uncharacterized cupin superfamily protein